MEGLPERQRSSSLNRHPHLCSMAVPNHSFVIGFFRSESRACAEARRSARGAGAMGAPWRSVSMRHHARSRHHVLHNFVDHHPRVILTARGDFLRHLMARRHLVRRGHLAAHRVDRRRLAGRVHGHAVRAFHVMPLHHVLLPATAFALRRRTLQRVHQWPRMPQGCCCDSSFALLRRPIRRVGCGVCTP
jgi:hypothetical protein